MTVRQLIVPVRFLRQREKFAYFSCVEFVMKSLSPLCCLQRVINCRRRIVTCRERMPRGYNVYLKRSRLYAVVVGESSLTHQAGVVLLRNAPLHHAGSGISEKVNYSVGHVNLLVFYYSPPAPLGRAALFPAMSRNIGRAEFFQLDEAERVAIIHQRLQAKLKNEEKKLVSANNGAAATEEGLCENVVCNFISKYSVSKKVGKIGAAVSEGDGFLADLLNDLPDRFHCRLPIRRARRSRFRQKTLLRRTLLRSNLSG